MQKIHEFTLPVIALEYPNCFFSSMFCNPFLILALRGRSHCVFRASPKPLVKNRHLFTSPYGQITAMVSVRMMNISFSRPPSLRKYNISSRWVVAASAGACIGA